MSGAQVDPHDKMRSRDVSKVARGEQAPRPVHEFGTVSRPPPPSSVKPKSKEDEDSRGDARFTDQRRDCCIRYYEYHRCLHEKGKGESECKKFEQYFRSRCPSEWIEKWDEEREKGIFPAPL